MPPLGSIDLLPLSPEQAARTRNKDIARIKEEAQGGMAMRPLRSIDLPALSPEQAARTRDKDVARIKEEAQGGMAIEREAAAAAAERAALAEEVARRLEGEAAGVRSRLAQLEGALKASQKDAARLKV